MKASRTLLFILSVFLLFGIAWFAFPAEGVSLGKLNLRFPSYAEARMEEQEAVDVDKVLDDVNKSFEMTCSKTQPGIFPRLPDRQPEPHLSAQKRLYLFRQAV